MEGIFLLVFALIEGVAIAAGAIIGGIITAVCSLLEIVFGVVWRMKKPTKSAPSRLSRRPKWWPKVRNFIWVVVGLLVLSLVIVNAFFFEPTVNYFTEKALTKRDAEFKHGGIRGNLFAGRIEVDDLEITAPNWNISSESLTLDVAVSRLLIGDRHLEQLTVKGFRGHAVLPQPGLPGKLPLPPKNWDPNPKPKKNFSVADLELSDIEMTMKTAGGELPPIHSVQIESMTCQDLNSKYAFFYLFFRSNTAAAINGKPLVITVEDRSPSGKRTRWKAEDLPLATFHNLGGFFQMLESGTVTIDVTDDWVQSDHLEVELDWQFSFSELQVTAPTDSVIRKRAAEFLNEAPEPVQFGFRLKMDPETFEGSATDVTQELASEISKALIIEAAKKTVQPAEIIREGTEKAVEGFKNLLDRARKKPEKE